MTVPYELSASLRVNSLFKEPLAATTLTFAAGKYFIAKLFHIAKRYFTNPVGIYFIAVLAPPEPLAATTVTSLFTLNSQLSTLNSKL